MCWIKTVGFLRATMSMHALWVLHNLSVYPECCLLFKIERGIDKYSRLTLTLGPCKAVSEGFCNIQLIFFLCVRLDGWRISCFSVWVLVQDMTEVNLIILCTLLTYWLHIKSHVQYICGVQEKVALGICVWVLGLVVTYKSLFAGILNETASSHH